VVYGIPAGGAIFTARESCWYWSETCPSGIARIARKSTSRSRGLLSTPVPMRRYQVHWSVHIHRADSRVAGASFDLIGRIQERPNDTDFGAQSALFQTRVWVAWNRTHWNVGVIAILDTGIDESNPDLAGHVSARHDFIGSSTGPTDVNGHGSNVAGIASAATNNGTGVAGMAYGTPLLNAKVADDNGQVALSALVDGINWVSGWHCQGEPHESSGGASNSRRFAPRGFMGTLLSM
jgi:Subtilase family